MKKFLISAALGAMLVAGGVAVAQSDGPDGPGPRHGLPGDTNGDGKVTKAELTASLEQRFAKLDLNGDGKITQHERKAAREKRFDEHFAKMDTDGNGQISKDEMKAAHKQRAEQFRGKGGPGMGMRRHGGMMGVDAGRDGADRDGVVTRDAFMARPLAMFDRMDADKDGTVTAEEAKAAWQKFGAGGHRRGAGHGDMQPPPPPAN